MHGGEAAEGPERDEVITAENERLLTRRRRAGDDPGNSLAGLHDLRADSARARRRATVASGSAALHVAAITNLVPEAPQTLLEPGRTDRRWPHVDATPSLAEVHVAPMIAISRLPPTGGT